jgi:hypothetical protein
MAEPEDKTEREELEEQDGELLPDREAMSTITPGFDPGLEPVDPPPDSPPLPAPE